MLFEARQLGRVQCSVENNSTLVELGPSDRTEHIESLDPDQDLLADSWQITAANSRALDAQIFHDDRLRPLNRHSRSDDEDRPPLLISAVATNALVDAGHRHHPGEY